MAIGLLGKKLGMTQIFKEDGKIVPATVIEAGPCYVLQVKGGEKDGYRALQCGFDSQKESRVNKPLLGRFKKADVKPLKFIKEIRVGEADESKYKAGDELKVDLFNVGDFVDITGTSIGKGFQGVMKRWNFKGHPASHGAKVHRTPGSIGASASPSRVFRGKHLPGRMGGKRITTQNMKVLKVDKDSNLLVVKGAVSGSKNSYLVIKPALKKKRQSKPINNESGAESKVQ